MLPQTRKGRRERDSTETDHWLQAFRRDWHCLPWALLPDKIQDSQLNLKFRKIMVS